MCIGGDGQGCLAIRSFSWFKFVIANKKASHELGSWLAGGLLVFAHGLLVACLCLARSIARVCSGFAFCLSNEF